MPALEVEAVHKRYAGFALQPTSFKVDPGEVFAVLGLNGAGKSTLLRTIAGTVLPDGGHIRVNGTQRRPGVPDPSLSVVLDGGRSLYWKMSVRENIDYFGALKGALRRSRRARRDEVLERAGLTEKGDSLVGTLSRGMQQRLVLAIAVMCDPRVLLLDEPTLGVDLVHEKVILQSIEMLRDRGCAIVLTSHQLEFVQRLASRALLIDNGRPGSPQSIDSIRAELGRKILEVVLEEVPADSVVERLHALGASVHAFSVRADATVTSLYSVLETLQPAPIVSCNFGHASLREVMESLSSRRVA
ncbi:ABC transporter ATP-binding protein [Stenotrophomonas sp. JAI102]|uniref:ABC transporter ATP-binding protein n=1 Tax=Stenotrophomonas sp. JAI102 TaxID=2723077 RepID=UPI0015CAE7AC|nr:ABC transporter ATP-binding protein [Stenotrophomonas sp. JAI102]NYF35932.1 ABC-2 type transport system ATP-binding protein [Stenotrophomonas sp. JAI102]